MFGQFLIRNGVINTAQLEEGLARQKEVSAPLGETLVSLGYLSKEHLDHYLQEHLLENADDILKDKGNHVAL